VLVIRGGLLEGNLVDDAEIKRLATLPPVDVLRAQLVGALSAPMATVVGVFTAPLRDFVGVLHARIDQLEVQGEVAAPEPDQAEEVEAAEEQGEPAAEAEPTESETEEQPVDGEES
jgi:large subunit ribosomal protein L10